ncbi:MAG: hypothetical protein WCF65_02825 [Parachlamydiaceae bacterium]
MQNKNPAQCPGLLFLNGRGCQRTVRRLNEVKEGQLGAVLQHWLRLISRRENCDGAQNTNPLLQQKTVSENLSKTGQEASAGDKSQSPHLFCIINSKCAGFGYPLGYLEVSPSEEYNGSVMPGNEGLYPYNQIDNTYAEGSQVFGQNTATPPTGFYSLAESNADGTKSNTGANGDMEHLYDQINYGGVDNFYQSVNYIEGESNFMNEHSGSLNHDSRSTGSTLAPSSPNPSSADKSWGDYVPLAAQSSEDTIQAYEVLHKGLVRPNGGPPAGAQSESQDASAHHTAASTAQIVHNLLVLHIPPVNASMLSYEDFMKGLRDIKQGEKLDITISNEGHYEFSSKAKKGFGLRAIFKRGPSARAQETIKNVTDILNEFSKDELQKKVVEINEMIVLTKSLLQPTIDLLTANNKKSNLLTDFNNAIARLMRGQPPEVLSRWGTTNSAEALYTDSPITSGGVVKNPLFEDGTNSDAASNDYDF